MLLRLRFSLLVLALFAVAACDSDTAPLPSDATSSLFEPLVLSEPATRFFDFPYPSDLRTDERGHPRLDGFPRARGLVGSAMEILEEERPGFTQMSGVYFRMSGPIDESALPTDPATVAEAGSLFWLVDVDEASPRQGQRLPAIVSFRSDPTSYWPGDALVLRPIQGVQLRPGTRYAVAVARGLRAADGSEVRRADAFDALVQGSGEATIQAHYDGVLAELEAAGLPRDEVLVATAFTTADPTVEMDALRDVMMAIDLPLIDDWQIDDNHRDYVSWRGTVETVEFLSGESPWTANFGDGLIRFDASGEPMVQVRRPLNVNVTVPRSEMPADGYPLVVYGHGTGGSDRTHLGERGEGVALASLGVAVLGFEAALHGERVAESVDVENLLIINAIAGREMVRQTVADTMLLFRIAREQGFDIPAERAGGDGVRFDPSRVLYMGHSQGAQEAGILLGIEPTVEAAFLSEGGGGAVLTIYERQFGGEPIACAIARLAVGVPCEEFTPDHPVMTAVIQPLLDPADPLAYAHRYYAERPADAAALSIAMTEATNDELTPPSSIEALAAAAGIPRVGPERRSSLAFDLAGVPTHPVPATDNLTLPDGRTVTAGVYQWQGGSHWVIYERPEARAQYVEFFRSALVGSPTIVGE